MAVDPRVLQAIGDPTAGRLTDIGKTYVNARQVAIENKRNAEKDAMLKQKFMQEQAIVGAKVGKTYAKDAMAWYDNRVAEGNPPSDEEFRDYQLEIAQRYEPAHQKFIPERLQGRDELQAGYNRFDTMLREFEPENYTTESSKNMAPDKKTVVVRTDKNSGLTYKQDVLYNRDGTERYRSPEYADVDVTAETSLTKSTQSNLNKDQLLAAKMQDDIAELETYWEDFGKGKMDYWSQAGDASIRMLEKLNIPITKGMEISSGQREKMKGRTKELQTSWRLHVTGSQAGKWEIKDITSQPLNMDDTNSQWKVKLPAWKDKADRIAVRSKLAQQQGFTYKETVKSSDGREFHMWTNEDTGESKPIHEFSALGEIPTMKEYMMSQLDRDYPDVENMTEEEKKNAIADVRQRANNLGYR